MRLALAFAASLAAAPVAAETPLLDRDCLEVLGPAIYGPQDFAAGIVIGIVQGYAIANGADVTDAKTGQLVGAVCREGDRLTFGEALGVLDQD